MLENIYFLPWIILHTTERNITQRVPTWEGAFRKTVLGLFPRVRSLTFLLCLQPFKVMLSPFSPLTPETPWGPIGPFSPLNPFGPRDPFGPFSPCSPLSPWGPFSPGGPWGPGGPGIMV